MLRLGLRGDPFKENKIFKAFTDKSPPELIVMVIDNLSMSKFDQT